MPMDTAEQSWDIRSDWLLLVEGKDEENLFEALSKHCFNNETGIQVKEAGGVNKFPRIIKAIRNKARTRPTLKSIGVVRDADEDADSAFRSVCAALHNADFKAPARHGEFSDGSPAIGVFIVPDGKSKGAIEKLCRRSVEDQDAARCVNEYLECLERHDAMRSCNIDKSFAHAYLASSPEPMARVGEGALQGAWDFDSPAFAQISQFIRALVSSDA